MRYRYPVSNTYVLVTRAFPQLAVHGNRVLYMRTVNYTRGEAEGEMGKKVRTWEKPVGKKSRKNCR